VTDFGKRLAIGAAIVVVLALLLAAYTLLYRLLAAAEEKYWTSLVTEVGIGLLVLLPVSLVFLTFLFYNKGRRAATRGRAISVKGTFVGWETAEGEFIPPALPPPGSQLTHLSVNRREIFTPRHFSDALEPGEQPEALPAAGDFEEERQSFEPERFFLGWMGE
jgi:hypothetical protein